jgi:hypothetical protein
LFVFSLMEAASFLFFFKIKDIANRKDDDENAPII